MMRVHHSTTLALLVLLAACQGRGGLFSCGEPASIRAEPAAAPARKLSAPRARSPRPGVPVARASGDASLPRSGTTPPIRGSAIDEWVPPEALAPEPEFPPAVAGAAPALDAGVASGTAQEPSQAPDASLAATPATNVDAATEPASLAETGGDAGSTQGAQPVAQAQAAAPESEAQRMTERFQAVYGIGRGSTGVGIGPGTTGEGSGRGYTGVGIGPGSTGTGSGRGATGDGSGSGWTGYGSGPGSTNIGSGQGATGFGSGRGSTGFGIGSSSTGFGSGSGSTGIGSGSGSTGFGLTPFGARTKERTAEAPRAR